MSDMFSRTQWFRNDRFGMFIHWGLYAIPGRGEWVMSTERIQPKDYEAYFHQFNPAGFNPRQWARAAKKAGMKYAVLTAKHHDGFCLFDSALTDYKSTNTQCRKDLVREFLEAFRAEGLKTGLYYSLIDWHHPDYPSYSDLIHPMRENPAWKEKEKAAVFDRYLDYMHGQIRELVSNYGTIDILWFDYSYEHMRNETWRAEELIRMVRSYLPDVIIDNRLETSGEGFGSIISAQPNPWSGDFASPEQIIPPEGILNEQGKPIPWELCTTVNNNWGYNPSDTDYKPPSQLIRKLVECVSKGGNMILNVSPDARGIINKQTLDILESIGNWLEDNGESIYGCDNTGIPKPEWGRYTGKGNTVYAHILENPIGPLALIGLENKKIKRISLLADGSEVRRTDSWITKAYEGIEFVYLGPVPHYTYALPDSADTVLKIELDTI